MNIHIKSADAWQLSLERELHAVATAAGTRNLAATVFRLRALAEIAERLDTDALIGLAAVVSNGRQDLGRKD